MHTEDRNTSEQTHQVYLLRLRREQAAGCWHISLQHAQGSRQVAFTDLDSLTRYLTDQMTTADTSA